MKQRKTGQLPAHDEVLGSVELGGETVLLFRSRALTLEFAEQQLRSLSRYRLLNVIKSILSAERFPSTDDAVTFLLGEVQMSWYTDAMGRTVPERCIINHIERRKTIMTATTENTAAKSASTKSTAPKGPRIKDVICKGLIAGTEQDKIIAAVHKQFPNAKTGPKDIAFYRYQLRKSGELPAVEHKTAKPAAKKASAKAKKSNGKAKKAATKKAAKKSRGKSRGKSRKKAVAA